MAIETVFVDDPAEADTMLDALLAPGQFDQRVITRLTDCAQPRRHGCIPWMKHDAMMPRQMQQPIGRALFARPQFRDLAGRVSKSPKDSELGELEGAESALSRQMVMGRARSQ